MTLADTELMRARWGRARNELDMVDPLAEGFAVGGLSGRSSPSFRVVALPADPELDVVHVDDEFLDWWRAVDPSPPDVRIAWSPNPTVNAAGVFRGEYEVPWDRYVAVRRHGGVDLGADLTICKGDTAFVPLVRVVALVWSAVRLQWLTNERVGAQGPWEVSVGLRDTSGSVLAQYAEGWQEPTMSFGRGPRCDDEGLLVRREVESWPTDEESVRDLAYELADRIEQCWGLHCRAFLVPAGRSRAGEFSGRPVG